MNNEDGTLKQSGEGMVKYAVSPSALTKEAEGVTVINHGPFCVSTEPLTEKPCAFCLAVKGD